jgi:4-aminobutyrate aminotransferase/(S)-3-amino-2-methylpropionate transaminase
MMALEFVRPGTLEPDAETTRAVVRACHQAGVIVLSCGSYGNVVRLLPPLVIDDALLAEGLDVLVGAIDGVLAGSVA